MEYMDERTAFPVRYTLHPVQAGTYPHAENQVWADADVSHAAECLIRLADDPALRRSVGEQARLHMRSHYSDQVLGVIYRRRLAAIARLPIVRLPIV